MKTIASLLLVLCLVSCSQPRPASKYQSVKKPAPAPIAQVNTNAPGTTNEEAMEEAAPAPAMASNQVAQAAPSTTAPGETNAVPSPFGHPAQPSVPAVAPTLAAHPAATNAVPEPLLPALSINFQGVPVDKVLQVYAEYVGRTLLRSPSVNVQTPITLVQQTPLTRTEIIHAMDAELALNNIAMIPIGDKFIKVVNLPEAGQVGDKIEQLNGSILPEFGPYKTRVVQLKYTKPSEMVPVLQQFTKTPSAILPIESSGMLVLRDSSENIQRMQEMIDMLDTSIPENIESAVIPIKYALASDIASALNSLSGGGGGGSFGGRSSGAHGTMGVGRTTGPGAGYGGGYGGATQLGGASAQGNISPGGLGGVGGSYAPGAAGGAANQTFAQRVQNLVQQASSGGKPGEFQILGQTKIIADERMNALLVFAGHEDMIRIKDLVKQLDVVLPQVLIEAIIMEVTLDNSRTIGVSAAQNPQGEHNVFVGGFNNGQNFFPFGVGGDSNSFPGNFTSTLPGNQLSYWGNFGNNFQVAVQAAENDSRVHVLSEPRIQTSHGVEADLFVGETIPYVNSTTAGAYGGVGVYNSYEQQQVGITLKVKPLINPDGLVVMDIYQEASEPGPSSTAVDINGTSVPTINQRQASATVAVKDRDTIILGGMISTTASKTKSGVPYLKDIPLLGNLFQSTANTSERVELIVLIRPTVLPTPEAAASIARAERKILPGVRRAEAEIRADEAERLRQANRELKDLDETNSVGIGE